MFPLSDRNVYQNEYDEQFQQGLRQSSHINK